MSSYWNFLFEPPFDPPYHLNNTINPAKNSYEPEDPFNWNPVENVDLNSGFNPVDSNLSSVLNHNEPSVSKNNTEGITMPSKVILDHRFSMKFDSCDLFYKDTGPYICLRCFGSVDKEEIAKHFFEKHGMLKDKFKVIDYNAHK